MLRAGCVIKLFSAALAKCRCVSTAMMYSNCCKFMLIDIACAIVENIVFVDDGKPLSLKRKRNKILYGQF